MYLRWVFTTMKQYEIYHFRGHCSAGWGRGILEAVSGGREDREAHTGP